MEDISLFIKMLERAGIRYNVDQSVDEDGQRSLDVYVYDNDSFSVFEFDAYEEAALKDFKIISGEIV